MLRFVLLTALALAPISAYAETASDPATPAEEPSVEKFLNGSDADRNAMMKDVVEGMTQNGYRELSVVPWFVVAAKNASGREVVLLVDPVSKTAMELQTEPDEKAELDLPNWRE